MWWDPAEPGDDVEAEAEAKAASAAPTASANAARAESKEVRSHPFNRPAPWGGPAPGPPKGRRLRWKMLQMFPSLMPTPRPTQRLKDAETVTFARREWVALHTPGHTFDHVCLLDPTEGVLLSGDHVLPTITPHISGFEIGADPLARSSSRWTR